MKTDIAYIVSHGFAARMVMQTNLLGLLVKEGKKVALIAPDKEDGNLKKYCQKNGIELYEFNPQSGFWTAQYHEARKYFLEDIKTNPALWEKHIYATKYNKSRNPWNHIRPRLLYLVYQLRSWFPGLKDWYKKREEKQLESEAASKLIKEIQPELLVSTYPVNFSEAMLLKAAKKQQAKTFIHLLSWDNISCKGHFPQLADEYIAWGPIMKEEFIEYYSIAEEKIHECGVPHFDLHRNNMGKFGYVSFLSELGLDPLIPYLFFGMSAPRFSPYEIDIVEWLAGKVEEGNFGMHLQLIIRPHPQNVQGSMADDKWIPRLDALKSKKVAIDYPRIVKSKMQWSMHIKDMDRLSKLLCGASISLNSCSTLCVDSLVAGVPVIVTGFDADKDLDYWYSINRVLDYPHLKKLLNTKGVERANSYNELESLINLYLENPNHNKSFRKEALYKECGKNQDATFAVSQKLLEYVSSDQLSLY